MIALQRAVGNQTVLGLLARPSAAAPTGPAMVQRVILDTYDIPSPSDESERAEYQKDPLAWQYQRANLRNVAKKLLTAAGASSLFSGMEERERASGNTTSFEAEAMSDETGGELDWDRPWRVAVNKSMSLKQGAVASAHELKHQEQWYAHAKPGLAIDKAAFEPPAKEMEAQVAANLSGLKLLDASSEKYATFLAKQYEGADSREDFRRYWFITYFKRYALKEVLPDSKEQKKVLDNFGSADDEKALIDEYLPLHAEWRKARKLLRAGQDAKTRDAAALEGAADRARVAVEGVQTKLLELMKKKLRAAGWQG